MPAWRPTLPQYVLAGSYSETPPNLMVEAAMSAGPVAVRRRSTAGEWVIRCAIPLTAFQKSELEALFYEDLKAGSLPLEWVHPVTRAATTFMMRTPQISAETGGASFIASLELRIQP
ncbi:MAG: hypothetical protein KDH19_09195 [Geminicoccaceae bacterium]|nr:hypothetical protein [Geminicoccaceae bacterium]